LDNSCHLHVIDNRKLASTLLTRKITRRQLHLSNNYKQKPPKKKGHFIQFFLRFSGHRIRVQEYDFGTTESSWGSYFATA
jgi:hypothetical protein